jgi:biofilm protein TabA
MIIDKLENFKLYISLHPLFADVARLLNPDDLINKTLGKRAIEGKDLIMTVDLAPAKTKIEARLEAHRKYIDIQIPLTGIETMGYSPLSECIPADAPYDEANDIVFFDGEAQNYISVKPGMFVIFFPGDAHAPCISSYSSKKVIFKVKKEKNIQ